MTKSGPFLLSFLFLPACGQGPAGSQEYATSSQQGLTGEPDAVTTSSADNAPAADAAQRATDAELARIKDYLDSRYTANDVRRSFQTKFGETIDCVDFFRHPGVTALAARGTRMTAIPTPPPPPPDLPRTTRPIGDPSDDSFNGLPDAQGRPRSCPRGTAPVVRVEAPSIIAAGGLDRYLTRQARKAPPPDPIGSNGEYHAHVFDRYTDPSVNITSGMSTLNVLSPVFSSGTSGRNFSLSQTWMSNTAKTQTVEVGWMVAESVNGVGETDPHLFIYATADGYSATGCYNNVPSGKTCLAWVPQDQSHYAPGMQLSAGAQSELTITTYYRSPSDSPGYTGPAAWWIYVQGPAGGSYLGYYPASEFGGGEMATRGGRYTLGAEVADTTNTWVVPMGTGASALAGLGQAGYHRNYRACTGGYAGGYTWCTSGGTFPTPTGFDGPQPNEFGYDWMSTGGGSGWAPYFFYGNNPAVFWGQDYGTQWSPVGDWNYGNYKGECGLGQPIIGLSKYTGGSHQGHAVLCGSKTIGNVTGSSCYLRSFANGDNRDPNTGTGNWERFYYYRGECASNEFVQGISQSTSGQVNGILCCPGTVAHTSCAIQTFYANNSSGYGGVDWDPYYYKGQCPAGKYVAGVSSIKSSRVGVVGAPHGILCCNQ